MPAPSVSPPSTSPLVRRYSLDEFFALDPPPGGGHYELIGGVLYMVPPPGWSHSVVVARLVRVFSRHQDAHADRCLLLVPRAAISTPRDTYLEPDLFLVSIERSGRRHAGQVTSADLVVETLSPSTAVYDRTAKADTYAALGVRELWLVDVDAATVEQRVLERGAWRVVATHGRDRVVESVAFADLRVPVAELFP